MVLSQPDYLYRIWSVEAGLPQISVTAIVQDQQGFLWLGTQNGLARFDGVQFTVFNTANTAALSSNLISALHFDAQQRLWIGTANGLILHDDGQFNRLDLASPLQGAVSGFAERADGSMLVGADRLYQWQQQQLQPVAEHKGPVFQLYQQQDQVWIGGQHGFAVLSGESYQWMAAPKELPTLQMTEIARVGRTLYLGTNQGLYSWKNGVWQVLSLPGQPADSRIELLYQDPQQQLWVATYGKVYRLEHGQLLEADVIQAADDFVWIESMLQDQHQNLWLGSRTHGLKRLRKAVTQRFSTEAGLPDPYIWAVQPWRQHMLVGTSKGLALLQHGQYQVLQANQQLPDLFVYSMLPDSRQHLWVGTRAGLSRLDADSLAWQRNYDSISSLLVTTLAEEGERIWVGTNGGLYYIQQDGPQQSELQQQGLPQALLQARVRIVLPDSAGRLWVGTENGLYLRTEHGFNRLDNMPLSGSFISAVTEFADGNILVGSFDQGFVLGQPGNWRWFSQKNGLPGNGVMHAVKVEQHLLISNFQGFYRVDYAALARGKVDKLYMLVDDRRPEAASDSHRCCNGAGSNKGAVHQGRIWYPTLDGVVTLPLQQLLHHAPVPAAVVKNLTTQQQQYSGSDVVVAAAQRDWHFRFTAPYYVQSSSLQLRYQLQGYESDWVEGGNRREAFYTNLPPGKYQFRVQARQSADYRWSEAAVMSVRLPPHWYETWLAKALLAVLILLSLRALYRWRLSALAHAGHELELQVAQRTAELHLANEKLQQMSMQDALTGLYNRHYLDSNIEQILSRTARSGGLLTLALLDLDHFKSINDKLGHQAGDVILKQVAEIVRQSSRSADHLIRWGGEEFLLILEHSDDVPRALQRVLQAIKQYDWRQLQLTQSLTCSVGAVSFSATANWQQQLQWADQALYWVKQHGRDGYLLLLQGQTLPDNTGLAALLSDGSAQVHSDKLPVAG